MKYSIFVQAPGWTVFSYSLRPWGKREWGAESSTGSAESSSNSECCDLGHEIDLDQHFLDCPQILLKNWMPPPSHIHTISKWNVQLASLLMFLSLHVLTHRHFEKKIKKNVSFENFPFWIPSLPLPFPPL